MPVCEFVYVCAHKHGQTSTYNTSMHHGECIGTSEIIPTRQQTPMGIHIANRQVELDDKQSNSKVLHTLLCRADGQTLQLRGQHQPKSLPVHIVEPVYKDHPKKSRISGLCRQVVPYVLARLSSTLMIISEDWGHCVEVAFCKRFLCKRHSCRGSFLQEVFM